MASRIVAQLLVAGATTVLRAASQAWHKALQNAHKSGVAQEAVKQTAKVGTSMSAQEARLILNVSQESSLADVAKRYKHMMEVNQKYGSFYLQSKVYRAWEALDQEYQQEGRKTAEDEAAVQRILHQDTAASDAQQAGQQQHEKQ